MSINVRKLQAEDTANILFPTDPHKTHPRSPPYTRDDLILFPQYQEHGQHGRPPIKRYRPAKRRHEDTTKRPRQITDAIDKLSRACGDSIAKATSIPTSTTRWHRGDAAPLGSLRGDDLIADQLTLIKSINEPSTHDYDKIIKLRKLMESAIYTAFSRGYPNAIPGPGLYMAYEFLKANASPDPCGCTPHEKCETCGVIRLATDTYLQLTTTLRRPNYGTIHQESTDTVLNDLFTLNGPSRGIGIFADLKEQILRGHRDAATWKPESHYKGPVEKVYGDNRDEWDDYDTKLGSLTL